MSRRHPNVRELCIVLGFLFVLAPSLAQVQESGLSDELALKASTDALCHAQVAMVGESATHGDGHTLAFKVGLVEKLIDTCGFDGVLFEANQEEFLHLNERLQSGQSVTPDDLLTAVGGLWKFYKEFQPLAPYLLDRVKAGRLAVGGMDDQLAQLGQNYANDEMIAEFTSGLALQEGQACRSAFHRRVYFDYPENAPYSKRDQAQLQACLRSAEEASAADSRLSGLAREERQQMIAATERWIDRDFTPAGESIANRDRSMFQTFQWWIQRHPKNCKVIVWAATVHIAKRGAPNWSDAAGTNFGSFVIKEYGSRARALGFSALEGSVRQGKGKFPALPIASANSIESEALKGSDASAVYIGSKELAAMGERPGAFFYHSYQALNWSDFLDGVVVFRTERPPTDTR